jgi:hypothetical protein
LPIVLAVGLIVRVAVLVSGWGSLALDDDAYGRLAVYWAETGTYGLPAPSADAAELVMRPTAYRPPLYPWLLSWFVTGGHLSLISVAVTHLWLGLATSGLTFAIASRLQVRWPALPALAVACDPILLRGSQLVMTETLITFLTAAIWALWLQFALQDETDLRPDEVEPGKPESSDQRPAATQHKGLGEPAPRVGYGARLAGPALLGLMLGLAVLTRPTMMPWALCLLLITAAGSFRTRVSARAPTGKELHGLACALLMGTVFVLTLLPWVIRNSLAFGTPIWATTHGGYTLLLANNPSLYAHFQTVGPSRDWDATDFHRHWAARHSGDPTRAEFWQAPVNDQPAPPIDELPDDRLAQQSAKATIVRQPGMFLLSCVYRVGWFWALAPHEASGRARLLIGVWYAVWFLCAAWGVVRIGSEWRAPLWLGAASVVLTLTLIHAVYWSNMRMRAPLMPIVYVVAAVAVAGRVARGARPHASRSSLEAGEAAS